jgi:homoserine O-acetyltransferase/O-succinyltransferase
MSDIVAAADTAWPLPTYVRARDFQWWRAGDVRLRSGEVLRDARLAFKTYGRLNTAGDNCIVFPTYYTGTHTGNERLIGAGRALDPARYFIVVPNLFGNGLSTSPSNAVPEQRGSAFPHVSIDDNVRCQQHLLMDHLGVRRIQLALGWSMGALQAYQWAVSFPQHVERLLPLCGSARCWPLNHVFLEGVKAALLADPAFHGGDCRQAPERGLRAFGRAYAGWAFSATFFREHLYRALGFTTLEDLLQYWERDHLQWDANDLLAMLWTWQHADPAAAPEHGGDLARALGAIRARTVVMPCDTDQYFTLQENRIEAEMVPGAQLRPLLSPFGHCAGAPGRFPNETAALEQALRELLAR